MLPLSLSSCGIPFSKSDSETWDSLLYSPNFPHFHGVGWGRVGPQRFPCPKQQTEQQQPSCLLCGTYHQLWVNTGSWHLKMETNKPGISTKPGNNAGAVPARLLHGFQRLCAATLGKKAASISLNMSLWHLLCASTLELCLDIKTRLCVSSGAPFSSLAWKPAQKRSV